MPETALLLCQRGIAGIERQQQHAPVGIAFVVPGDGQVALRLDHEEARGEAHLEPSLLGVETLSSDGFVTEAKKPFQVYVTV